MQADGGPYPPYCTLDRPQREVPETPDAEMLQRDAAALFERGEKMQLLQYNIFATRTAAIGTKVSSRIVRQSRHTGTGCSRGV